MSDRHLTVNGELLAVYGCENCGWTEFAFEAGERLPKPDECPDCGVPVLTFHAQPETE